MPNRLQDNPLVDSVEFPRMKSSFVSLAVESYAMNLNALKMSLDKESKTETELTKPNTRIAYSKWEQCREMFQQRFGGIFCSCQ